MFFLKESEYNKVIEPLKKVTINKLFAIVVVERKVLGKIYVNDVENPTTFYIVHPYGMSLLFGNTENTKFNEKLSDYLLNKGNLRDKIEWLQVFPNSWCAKIELILGENLIKNDHNPLMDFTINNNKPDGVIENTRVNFIFNRTKYARFREQLTHDSSYKIVRIDEKIYTEELGSVVAKHFWNDAVQFLRDGIGFSLLCDVDGVSVVAATAFSSFIVGDKLEIGIETKAQFRGKGFALIVCSHLIDYCLRFGFEPVWSCRLENTASYKAAQKLGFEPEKYLPYFMLSSFSVPRKITELKHHSPPALPEKKLSSCPDSFVAKIGSSTTTNLTMLEKQQEKQERQLATIRSTL